KKKVAKLGSIYSRKGVWYVRFMVNGKEYRESSKSTDENVALAFLEKRRNEVIERRVIGPRADRTTFGDLVSLLEADYAANARKSTRSMRCRVKRLRQTFGTTRPVDILHADLTGYVAKRQRDGAKPATIRYELGIPGRAFNLAIKAGMLT